MKVIIITAIFVILSGCAIGPQTKQELYDNYGYMEKRCSQESHEKIYKMLFRNMNICISGQQTGTTMAGSIPVNWNSNTTIQSDFDVTKGSTLAAYVAGGPGQYFYTTVVNISTTGRCKSELKIYGYSSMNKRDLNMIDHWLLHNDNCTDD